MLQYITLIRKKLSKLLMLIKKNSRSNGKNILTKYVSFHVLHTCTKFQQPRGNNKKVPCINF